MKKQEDRSKVLPIPRYITDFATKLQEDCPLNDCIVFLNIYKMYDEQIADYKKILAAVPDLSDSTVRSLRGGYLQCERELLQMYNNNYAVVRQQHILNPRTPLRTIYCDSMSGYGKRDLKNALDDHQLWVESNGEAGKRADLFYCDLSNCDFSGLKLDGINFEGSDLSGTNLSHCSLSGTNFKNANLIAANLSDATGLAPQFEGANLKDADFSSARITNANFKFVKSIGNIKGLPLKTPEKAEKPSMLNTLREKKAEVAAQGRAAAGKTKDDPAL